MIFKKALGIASEPEDVFGTADITSAAMKSAIAQWYDLYFRTGTARDAAWAQRIPYTVVDALQCACFGEYRARAVGGGLNGSPTADAGKAAGFAASGGGRASGPTADAGKAAGFAASGGGDAADAPGAARLAEARDTLRMANQRLLEAMVMQQASAVRLSPRGAAAALQMADLAPCMAGGAPDEVRVRQALCDFAASWPEFTVCQPPAPFAAGAGTDSIRQDVLKNALGVL